MVTSQGFFITILPCVSAGQDGWLDLRQALWPDCPRDEHLAEMQSALDLPNKYAQFLASGADGRAAGFVEASLRGCSELASDAPLDNVVSHAMHAALGFEETERVVYFRKPLPSS